MGLFFNEDKKYYCGRYKGIDVWQFGSMIGNNWYGYFYITEKRGKSQRNMKVEDSVHKSSKALKKWINEVYLPKKKKK